jgi:hypothetical protein
MGAVEIRLGYMDSRFDDKQAGAWSEKFKNRLQERVLINGLVDHPKCQGEIDRWIDPQPAGGSLA